MSQTAVVEAGVGGPEAEAAFERHGLRLGPVPQSHQQATSGGGRFEENIVAATVATPTGELRIGGRVPAGETAAGPKVLDTIIGSEGLLGVITEVTVQLTRRPRLHRQETWALRDTERGFEALRDLAQQLGPGIMPDISRLSDANETTTVMSRSGIAGIPSLGVLRARGWREPALAVFQLEGQDQSSLRFRRRQLAKVLKRHGAARMPDSIAEHWLRNRFHGPHQRDRLMDRGVFIETVETATTWGNVEHLHGAVRSALTETLGERSWVQCHVSHLDRGGASLRYTVMANGESDPLAQWERVQAAASDAMIAAGGSVTHHQGDGGGRILRALRAELDPTGILDAGRLRGHG